MTVPEPAQVLEQAVLIFAKAPVLGTVKTRMETALSQQQALALHQQLVQHTYQQLSSFKDAVRDVAVELWVSAEHSYWSQFESVDCFVQQGDDLGQRLHQALGSALQRYRSVVIIGSDCPFIDAGYLQQAFRTLRQNRVVLGPATDGGYVLIGATDVAPELFEDIYWGTDQVLEQTRRQLRRLGWAWHELEPRPDIDRPEDIALLDQLPGFQLPEQLSL